MRESILIPRFLIIIFTILQFPFKCNSRLLNEATYIRKMPIASALLAFSKEVRNLMPKLWYVFSEKRLIVALIWSPKSYLSCFAVYSKVTLKPNSPRNDGYFFGDFLSPDFSQKKTLRVNKITMKSFSINLSFWVDFKL